MAERSGTQHEQAARFFDGVSGTYRDKYTRASAFHHYFFSERIDKATRDLDLSNADVLDIGSGTGNLYDDLIKRFPAVRFFATDVSAGMLLQSPVPADRKFTGHAYDHTFGTRAFNAIFMLGVTTYLSPEELEKNLAFIASSLKPGGKAVITFSNAHALDTWMRAVARWPLSLLGRKDKVLASGLELRTYSISEVRRIIAPHLSISRVDLLNHTVFPFNILMQGIAVAIAKRLDLYGSGMVMRGLSSDLLIHAERGD